MVTPITLRLNGQPVRAAVEAQTPLLYALRNELGQRGPRFGCGLAQCGACTVHVQGRATRSCVIPSSTVQGQAVTTLDGLAAQWRMRRGITDPSVLHPVQQAFIDEEAAQCGYCINGWIMTAAALLEAKPAATDEEIKQGLSGLKCRCGTQVSVLRAVKRAAVQMRSAKGGGMKAGTKVGIDAGADVNAIDRRGFLAGGAGLLVSIAMPVGAQSEDRAPAVGDGLPRERLDSWLAIDAQGRVIASSGKIDAGLGIPTAFAQIVADELDVDFAQVTIRMGDTATTVDQRGTGSSNGITDGGTALRTAAAQARAFLLGRATERMGVPAAQLQVRDGVVRVVGDESRRVSYGELLAGGRFELALDAKAQTKPASAYRWVGKPVPRSDLPAKVSAQYEYLVDFKLPGMVHARVLRPPTAGASFLGVQTMPKLPGFIRLVQQGNFVAVVCEREEQAVLAAQRVKLKWSAPTVSFSRDYDTLYETLRTAPAKGPAKVESKNGDVDAALAAAARRVEARYEYPFQSHACMGPACAVAQITPEQVTVWMGGQKPYPLRPTVAEMLGRPKEQVRVVWLPGPGSYGMNDADDAAVDAVIVAREVGRPVRLQYSREEATAWDAKGPPGVFRMRGGLDAAGKVVAFDYFSRGYSGRTRPSGTSRFGDSLASQLVGGHETRSQDLVQISAESYRFDNKRVAGELVEWKQSLATGLRTAHLRDPDGMATCFASESFIDELALAAAQDPVAFRLQHLAEPRHAAVVKAAAEKAGWQARVGPHADSASNAAVLRGRGIAYAPRNGAVVAMVAEVEVQRATGQWRATRFVVAHDCGLVINPRSLEGVVESNILMSLSRTRHEEVRFDEHHVRSVDWLSYPILDITEVPDSIELVIVGNQGSRSYGAGEPSTRPVAAALANALFDATGRRLRRVPFTPERLRAALQAPAVASGSSSTLPRSTAT